MTASNQSVKRKLSLLALAEELQNVFRACQLMGYHRDSFYEVRRAFQVGGVAALVENKRGRGVLTPTAFPWRSRRRSSNSV